MKHIKNTALSAGLAAIVLLASPAAQAANGTWTTGASGNWNIGTNWVGGTVANGIGDTATVAFTSASRALTLNGVDQTIGTLDISTSLGGLSVLSSAGAILTMDNNLAQAQINVTGATGIASTISAPIRMTVGGLRIAALATGGSSFTLSNVSSAATSGTQTLELSHAGSSPLNVSNISDGAFGGTVAILVTTGGTQSFDANTFTGGITMRSGTLRTKATGLGSGTLTIGDASSPAANAILAPESGTYTNNIVVTAAGSASPRIAPNVLGQTIEFTGTFSLGKTLLVAPNAGSSITFSNSISGIGGLNIDAGSGTASQVTLSVANSFSGTTQVKGVGTTLNLRNATAVGTGTLQIGAGTLAQLLSISLDNTSGGAMTLTNNNALNLANFNFVGTDDLNLGTGAVTVSAARSIVTVQANRLTIGGVIGGAKSVGNAGPGTLLLTGANTYTGATTVGGLLSVSSLANGLSASNIGGSTNVAANLILNRGTLQYTGAAVNTDRLFTVGSGGGAIASNGSGAMNFNNAGANVSTETVTLTPSNSSGVSFGIGATTIAVRNTSELAVGQSVSGVGIAVGTTITSVIDGNEIVLSQATTAASNLDYTFGPLNRTLTLTGSNTGNNTIAGSLENSATTTLGVTKSGAGKWILSGANTFTGTTMISAGTLEGSGATSLTTSSTINVTGGSAGAAKLTVGSAQNFASKTVNITTLGGGEYQKDLAASAAYTTYGASRSAFVGGTDDTTASFLDSTNSLAGGSRNVVTSFSANPLALVTNDVDRLSDVFSLSGTSTDIFVLQLNVSTIDSDSYLAWNNAGSWVNAIQGNTAIGGSQIANFAGSFTSSNATATSAFLGSWGYDDTNNNVWAVLNHNSEFAVAMIPEPNAFMLMIVGLAALIIKCRRRKQPACI